MHTLLASDLLHLFGDVLLRSAPHVNVLALGRRVVAGNCLAEPLRLVVPRPVQENGMEEHGVPLLHLEERLGVVVVAAYAVIHLVHAVLPVWVLVLHELQLVAARHHEEAAIVGVHLLHGRPSAHDAVSGPEGEVVKVLMHGVSRGSGAGVRRLVDEHRVHGHDVGPREALNIVKDLRQHEVRAKDLVPHEVLDLVNGSLSRDATDTSQGDVLHHRHPGSGGPALHEVQETEAPTINEIMRDQVGDEQEPIVLIELPLSRC